VNIVYDLVWEVDPLRALERSIPGTTFRRVRSDSEAADAVAEADALVLSGQRYTASLADAIRRRGERLRWIQMASVGLDSLARHGVPERVLVTNASGLKGRTVGEHAFALLLALFHGLPEMERNRQAGDYAHQAMRERVSSVEGARLLIAGYGSIGREIARKAKAFDMHVTAVNRSGRGEGPADELLPLADLARALPGADAVVVAMPLASGTRGLFDRSMLERLDPRAYLVNVGRGELVDQSVLAELLAARRIRGAALDVFVEEPLPSGDPLWDLPNVILSPHIAGAASQNYDQFAALVAENVGRFMRGEELLNVVSVPRQAHAASGG